MNWVVLGQTGKFRASNLWTSRKLNFNVQTYQTWIWIFAIEPNLPRLNLEPSIFFEKLPSRAKFLANLSKQCWKNSCQGNFLKNISFSKDNICKHFLPQFQCQKGSEKFAKPLFWPQNLPNLKNPNQPPNLVQPNTRALIV